MVEPRGVLGLGIAYSTQDPWHRLNVPATVMSALSGEPDHFLQWSGERPEAFARRVDYGRYVRDVLADAVATSRASLRHVVGVAQRIDPDGDGMQRHARRRGGAPRGRRRPRDRPGDAVRAAVPALAGGPMSG